MAAPPPPSDNILFNGTGKDANGNGNYLENTVSQGKKYLLRIINSSSDNNIRVSLDNHQFLVVATDFTPVKPISTDSLLLGIGQRYEVIITADQPIGNYWMRATAENACASSGNNAGMAIFRYEGAPGGDPTTNSTAVDNGCNPPAPLTPWVPNNVGDVDKFNQQVTDLEVDLNIPGTTTNNQNIVTWAVNMSAIDIQWEVPTLTYVKTGNTSYPRVANVIELPFQNIWSYWIIQETQGGPVQIAHPMHLHGHDFYVLGRGTGMFNKDTDTPNLTFQNPTRRDTEMLPAGGWLVLAFPTDNPGAWLFHCHIVSAPRGLRHNSRANQIASSRGTSQRVSESSSWSRKTLSSYRGRIMTTSAMRTISITQTRIIKRMTPACR